MLSIIIGMITLGIHANLSNFLDLDRRDRALGNEELGAVHGADDGLTQGIHHVAGERLQLLHGVAEEGLLLAGVDGDVGVELCVAMFAVIVFGVDAREDLRLDHNVEIG